MATREEIIQDAIGIMRKEAIYPDDNINTNNIWLGIYQTLLWCETVNQFEYEKLPHIIDADKLRPKKLPRHPNTWQGRADAVQAYLADRLNCQQNEVHEHLDKLMKMDGYIGLQRQNITGIASVGLIKYALETLGANDLEYELEADASSWFAGINFPGRSSQPRIDILVFRKKIPLAIISSKWSLRHDRINDLTNECPIYKSTFQRIYRGGKNNSLKYIVVTNEFDPARLNRIITDSCIDAVVQIHKPSPINICKLNGMLNELWDLSDLIEDTKNW